jgi:uncharacterized protein (TIGR02217 family)
MAFDSVVFPQSLMRNSVGGPGFKTDIVEIDSGAEERIARWSQGRHAWDVRLQDEFDDLIVLKSFYLARQGAARGFLVEDPMDNTSNADGRTAPTFNDVDIGLGDGSTLQFQLVKKYTSGGITNTRTIEKPQTGTVLVGLDDVSQGSGWSINYSTGVLTFTVAPGVGVDVQAGFKYYVPVRFGEDADEALRIVMFGGEAGELTNVPLIEIKNEVAVREELPAGGLVQETLSASRQISPAEAQTYLMTVNDATHDLILPNTDGIGSGLYFYIDNSSTSTQALTVIDDTGAPVAAIAAGDSARVGLIAGFGVKAWVAWANT